jgi:hypothetical protein
VEGGFSFFVLSDYHIEITHKIVACEHTLERNEDLLDRHEDVTGNVCVSNRVLDPYGTEVRTVLTQPSNTKKLLTNYSELFADEQLILLGLDFS